MPHQSAGILLYRRRSAGIELLLIHPGGPYWHSKDDGAWSIPKGEFEPNEDPFTAACREFSEETGGTIQGEPMSLTPLRQPGGKIVHAFAIEGDFDPAQLRSNEFTMEWPPRSGRQQEFPEADRAEWFTPEQARKKLLKGQLGFLDQLLVRLPKPAT